MGDKVWFACEELTVTKVDKENNLINLSDKFNKLRFESPSGNKDIHHDHDRKISAAVQKAIEENETKPVRKVKRWINFEKVDNYLDGKYYFHVTEEKARQTAEIRMSPPSECDYLIIAHGIEIEEDKL